MEHIRDAFKVIMGAKRFLCGKKIDDDSCCICFAIEPAYQLLDSKYLMAMSIRTRKFEGITAFLH
jgi:hypothetical protein